MASYDSLQRSWLTKSLLRANLHGGSVFGWISLNIASRKLSKLRRKSKGIPPYFGAQSGRFVRSKGLCKTLLQGEGTASVQSHDVGLALISTYHRCVMTVLNFSERHQRVHRVGRGLDLPSNSPGNPQKQVTLHEAHFEAQRLESIRRQRNRLIEILQIGCYPPLFTKMSHSLIKAAGRGSLRPSPRSCLSCTSLASEIHLHEAFNSTA